MPPRPRRGKIPFKGIPSTISKMTKRKKTKTPPPPRISSRILSNPPVKSRSRPTRDSTMSGSPPSRRMSSSPVKTVIRKPRENLRSSPKRTIDTSKMRDRTPEKKYIEKPQYEGPSKDHHQRPLYTKDSIWNMNIRVPGYFKEDKYDSSITLNRTFSPESFSLVRRQGEGSVPIFDQILKGERKHDDYDSGPSHSNRLQFENSRNYTENPQREFFFNKEKDRGYTRHSRRPFRDDYEHREERSRDDSRYQPSTSSRRSRSFDRSPPERKDRYEEREMNRRPRQSLERERTRDREKERDRFRERGDRERDRSRNRSRSPERLVRIQHSPSPRRHAEQYREESRGRPLDRRQRSLDRRARSLDNRVSETSHFRDSEHSSRERFSNLDHSEKNRSYYEVISQENPSPSYRGRGGGFHSRGRGGSSGRPFIRNSYAPPIPPMNTMRGPMRPRAPIPGRRPPFISRKSFRGSMQGRL